jgi:hypothetical protein
MERFVAQLQALTLSRSDDLRTWPMHVHGSYAHELESAGARLLKPLATL